MCVLEQRPNLQAVITPKRFFIKPEGKYLHERAETKVLTASTHSGREDTAAVWTRGEPRRPALSFHFLSLSAEREYETHQQMIPVATETLSSV